MMNANSAREGDSQASPETPHIAHENSFFGERSREQPKTVSN